MRLAAPFDRLRIVVTERRELGDRLRAAAFGAFLRVFMGALPSAAHDWQPAVAVLAALTMVLGMAPVVGVTLPFISYGGSSLLTFFLGMGMVASVSLRKHGY